MDSQKIFKTAGIVLVTAIIQSIVFCLIVGFPLPQFTASRDVETLQFQPLPEQKRTQPIQALESQPIPEPQPTQVAPVAHEPIKSKVRPPKKVHAADPVAKIETKQEPKAETKQAQDQTHVVVVNFDKGEKEKAAPATPEEKASFTPVSDKLAGVQSDDSQTEATADVNSNPTDHDSSAAMDSIEKSESN